MDWEKDTSFRKHLAHSTLGLHRRSNCLCFRFSTESLLSLTEYLTMTGLVRFALAVLNFFILAFLGVVIGVVIGVWFAAYGGGEDRLEMILEP